MPNPIKYSTSAETLALKTGDFWIGTGDVGKGPTDTTGFYNGITPPSGGYTIYLNKASQGPSIYQAANDADLITFTNQIGGTNFTAATQCLNWYNTQSDKFVQNIDYPSVITNGLILNVDGGFTPSYSRSGTTWYDLSTNAKNGTLTNGPTFNSNNNGYIVLDGVDDFVSLGTFTGLGSTNRSLEVWCSIISLPGSGNRRIVNFPTDDTSTDAPAFTIGYSTTTSTLTGGLGGSPYDGYLFLPTFTLSTWMCVTITYSGSLLSAYFNGAFHNSKTNTGGTPANPIGYIGRYNSFYGQYGNVNVASVRLYNRALSASEVLLNYNAVKTRFGL